MEKSTKPQTQGIAEQRRAEFLILFWGALGTIALCGIALVARGWPPFA